MRDARALNGGVIEQDTPELWDANEEVHAGAQADFDALKEQRGLTHRTKKALTTFVTHNATTVSIRQSPVTAGRRRAFPP